MYIKSQNGHSLIDVKNVLMVKVDEYKVFEKYQILVFLGTDENDLSEIIGEYSDADSALATLNSLELFLCNHYNKCDIKDYVFYVPQDEV